MNRKLIAMLLTVALLCSMICGCVGQEQTDDPNLDYSGESSQQENESTGETADISSIESSGSLDETLDDTAETTGESVTGETIGNTVTGDAENTHDKDSEKPEDSELTETTDGTNTDVSKPATDNNQSSTEDTKPENSGVGKKYYTYEEYQSLDGKAQEAYFNSFDTPDDFFEWYNAAMKEYEDNRKPPIEVGDDTVIDLGDLTDGN